MELSLVLDVIVALLLAATIVYAALLNRRLQSLRANRSEFEAMIGEFNEATRRAEGAIQTLRMSAEQTAKTLSTQVEKAQALRDELGFMMTRADTAADRLVGGKPEPVSRPQPQPASPPPRSAANAMPPPRPAPAPIEDDEPQGGQSKAERDLLKALRELR
jgi:seryl-tRNA synthetase